MNIDAEMSMPETNELVQLAQTFSTACEKVMEERKVATDTSSVVAAVSKILIVPSDKIVESWWA